uniref:Uncharacterized protein n=1 Tax=viral metagenome TaxID=1070528 RepID=A0A6M3LQK3_9ZZZZ
MGFNSTIMICNDHLHDIENDPKFGAKVSNAIGCYDYDTRPFLYNGLQVIETHHADGIIVSAVGGNGGKLLGDGGWSRNLVTYKDGEDWKIKVLRELANNLGYSIRKKRNG